MLMETYYEVIGQSEVDTKDLNTKFTEMKQKIAKVEERFAYGDIDREIYDKVSL